jgi:hypothetical protein
MKDYFILLFALAVVCANASKICFPCVFKQQRRKALSPVSNSNASKCVKLHQMRTKGANLSTDILVHVGKFLTPRDLVVKMKGNWKQWSKVNWNLMYENLTPTNDPIAVFKKIDEEKFFLEDPMNLLDPAINGFNGRTNTQSPNQNSFLTTQNDAISLRLGRNFIRSLDHFARRVFTMIHPFRIKKFENN